MNEAEPQILILVMGATGAGKTTFINQASGSSLRVGETLDSCTSEVDIASPFELDDHIVTLVDSPGFDDTNRSEADILQEVSSFLTQTYQDNRLLSGIIFMHNITDNRMGGVARRNLNLFYSLCGEQSLKNVVVVTNMWTLNPSDVVARREAQREKELASNTKFFKTALESGAHMLRHVGSPQSAHDIVRHFLQREPRALGIQRELVDDGRVLADTAAGVLLGESLDVVSDGYQREITQLTAQYRQEEEALRAAQVQEMRWRQQEFGKEREALRAQMEELERELARKTHILGELRDKKDKNARKKRQLFEKGSVFDGRVRRIIQNAFKEVKEFSAKRQRRKGRSVEAGGLASLRIEEPDKCVIQ